MNLVFLCVANSARSQIAEALAKNIFIEHNFKIESAGSNPTSINPLAIDALNEVGIDISEKKSKGLHDIDLNKADLIITLCKEESCPVLPQGPTHWHWPLHDPANPNLSRNEALVSFKETTKKIKSLLIENKNRIYDFKNI